MNKKPDRKPIPAPSPIPTWECPNCGQQHFGDPPPDMCDYCNDFTTWRRVSRPPNEKPNPRAPRR